MKKLTIDEAEALAMATDYAVFACDEENKINIADAGAFFLEGYKYVEKKHITLEECLREEFLLNTNYPKEYKDLFFEKFKRVENRFNELK